MGSAIFFSDKELLFSIHVTLSLILKLDVTVQLCTDTLILTTGIDLQLISPLVLFYL